MLSSRSPSRGELIAAEERSSTLVAREDLVGGVTCRFNDDETQVALVTANVAPVWQGTKRAVVARDVLVCARERVDVLVPGHIALITRSATLHNGHAVMIALWLRV